MDIVTDGEGRPVLSEDTNGRPTVQVREGAETNWRPVEEVLTELTAASNLHGDEDVDIQSEEEMLDGPEEAAQERELEIAVAVQEEIARQVAAQVVTPEAALEQRRMDLRERAEDRQAEALQLQLREEARRGGAQRGGRSQSQQADAEDDDEGPELPFWVSTGGGCLGHLLIFLGASQIGGCISRQVMDVTGNAGIAAGCIGVGVVLWIYGSVRYGKWRLGEVRRLEEAHELRQRLDQQAAQVEAAREAEAQDGG